jgi:anti-sigma B factor antagonist
VDFHWRKTKDAHVDHGVGILCRSDGVLCHVSLAGRITIDSSPDLRLSLLQHLESPACHSLTLDFYDVAYIDTSGLAVLVEVLKAARDRGKALYLSRLRERPRYLLEATRLAHLFKEVQ